MIIYNDLYRNLLYLIIIYGNLLYNMIIYNKASIHDSSILFFSGWEIDIDLSEALFHKTRFVR